MKGFTRTRVSDRIFLLRFATQFELAATFLRFQEHYESSRFRRRVFTLEEYMDWYASRFGAFTYYEDWSGFNIPSTALLPFKDGKFDPLSRRERRLLRALKGRPEPFYVIGIASDDELTHELAHALYFTKPDYQREIRRSMRGVDTTVLRRRLAALGYHRSVLTDEVHAYLISSDHARISRHLRVLQRRLRLVFRRYAKELRVG